MKKLISIWFLLFLSEKTLAKECDVHFVPESYLLPLEGSQEFKEISKIANTVLKKTYEVAQKIDEATLGLAAAVLTNGLPLENLAPEQWIKFKVQGQLVFSDSFMGETPLRGSKMTFTDGSYTRTIVTSHSGEFSASFIDLIPTYRFRIFSQPNIERTYHYVRLVDLPLNLKIETPFCALETKIYEVPKEPFRIVLAKRR